MKLTAEEIKNYHEKGLLESVLLGQGMMPLEALKIVLEEGITEEEYEVLQEERDDYHKKWIAVDTRYGYLERKLEKIVNIIEG